MGILDQAKRDVKAYYTVERIGWRFRVAAVVGALAAVAPIIYSWCKLKQMNAETAERLKLEQVAANPGR